MLKFEQVGIAFGREVLFTDFNLNIGEGEIVCLSGKSGRGKTSLLRAVLGFIPLQRGTITVENVVLSKETVDEIRRYIAWIPQELTFPAEYVKELVQMPFKLKANRTASFSFEKLMEEFDFVGLEHELYNKRVAEISGGQRQRIMVAVACLLQKKIVLVDEPTSALDANSSQKVFGQLKEMAQHGASILCVSHDNQFVASCDRVIEL